MLRLTRVLGSAAEPAIADRLHDLAHDEKIEYITLGEAETARRHFRARTHVGTECAVVLSRSERLENGAVLLLEAERAVVVRLATPRFLKVRAVDAAAALQLGYFAGNMHWKVAFSGSTLSIQLDGAEADYLARLEGFIAGGRAHVVQGEEGSPNGA